MDEAKEVAIAEAEEKDWFALFEGAVMRLVDGEASDEDMEFILSNLPVLGDKFQQSLQSIAEKLEENAEIILFVLMLYKMRRKKK